MSKMTKPIKGVFAAVTPAGHIWVDTIRFRARDARTACGAMLIGCKLPSGAIVDNPKAGWSFGQSKGWRIERVTITPAGRSALNGEEGNE